MLVGQTPIEINGMKEGSEAVEIKTREGHTLLLRYEQDCCASCSIAQIDGDPLDLLGLPLRMCEMVDNDEPGKDEYGYGPDESFTWTFVKFGTTAGYVTLRWYGSSNGYYSEAPTAYFDDKDETGHRRWR